MQQKLLQTLSLKYLEAILGLGEAVPDHLHQLLVDEPHHGNEAVVDGDSLLQLLLGLLYPHPATDVTIISLLLYCNVPTFAVLD